jgi:predicted transposase YbfD/YdcC
MAKSKSIKLSDHFSELTDPRRREPIYPLVNIVTMAVCAVICGADDFVAIAKFANTKSEWFASFLDLESGIPSHDRFNAIFAAIKPAEFEKCLLSWITSLHELTDGQIVAIDGKTLRGSFDAASSKAAIHMVSAWATANHITLGQVKVDAKSNEITAIPKLLETLELAGSLVTIDAMGCQVEIAQAIVDAGADYVLAVKGNQPTLHAGIVKHFETHMENDFADASARRFRSNEKGHGRVEERMYVVCPAPTDLPDRDRWPELKAIGVAMNIVVRNGKEYSESRYYILSDKLPAKRFAEAARAHWGIENNLHWQLDVTFQEDKCRIRMGHADANFSTLRRSALSMLKHETTAKVGIKNKRLLAGWNEEYLRKVLLGQ